MSTAYRYLPPPSRPPRFIFRHPRNHHARLRRGDVVAFNGDVSPGTIVVRTNERRLYLVLGQGRALAYPVGVGRAGAWRSSRQRQRACGARHVAASTSAGRRRANMPEIALPRSFPAARRTIRWASRR